MRAPGAAEACPPQQPHLTSVKTLLPQRQGPGAERDTGFGNTVQFAARLALLCISSLTALSCPTTNPGTQINERSKVSPGPEGPGDPRRDGPTSSTNPGRTAAS